MHFTKLTLFASHLFDPKLSDQNQSAFSHCLHFYTLLIILYSFKLISSSNLHFLCRHLKISSRVGKIIHGLFQTSAKIIVFYIHKHQEEVQVLPNIDEESDGRLLLDIARHCHRWVSCRTGYEDS